MAFAALRQGRAPGSTIGRGGADTIPAVAPTDHSTAPPLEGRARPLAPLLPESHVPLRLTVARGALGIELYAPVEIGPLSVSALSFTLPGLRFPLDLAGGVPAFRHRRGDLEHVSFALGRERLATWLRQRCQGVLGPLVARPAVWTVPDGVGVGLVGEDGAVAFELLWAPELGDARVLVTSARGAALAGPALGYALRVVDTAFGGVFEREGRVLSLRRAGALVGRTVLPAVGARVPACERVTFGALDARGDELSVELDSTFAPPELSERVARALELAVLTADADDALARGDLDVARQGYLSALERAPRHRELTRLVAEIDAFVGGRAEAALGLLAETQAVTEAGAYAAELLARTGNFDGARQAIVTATREEPYAPLAALCQLRLAELCDSARDRMDALDEAVARAPGLDRARWARLQARLHLGDVEGALADAEHLEAAAVGARARHDACMRAARALLERGFVRQAGRTFERALRYAPDDAMATAGLARALLEAGRGERAFGLLARAVALSERGGQVDADALLDMAKLLAERMADLPQAIARVREVPASSDRGTEARYLEATWRARLGDIAGASLAYARLRDNLELARDRPARAVEWLAEAARFERDVQRDLAAAERHLAIALAIAPQHAGIAREYREVAASLSARRRRGVEPEPGGSSDTIPPPDPGELSDRIERLQAALRAAPEDTSVALELGDALVDAGRLQEAHAVVMAQLEDAPPPARAALVGRARALLQRLADEARGAGRVEEAALYDMARDALEA